MEKIEKRNRLFTQWSIKELEDVIVDVMVRALGYPYRPTAKELYEMNQQEAEAFFIHGSYSAEFIPHQFNMSIEYFNLRKQQLGEAFNKDTIITEIATNWSNLSNALKQIKKGKNIENNEHEEHSSFAKNLLNYIYKGIQMPKPKQEKSPIDKIIDHMNNVNQEKEIQPDNLDTNDHEM